MNTSIQWLEKVFFISLMMPGVFIFCLKPFSIFVYKKLGTIYLLILLLFELVGAITLKKWDAIEIIALVSFGSAVPIIVELNIRNVSVTLNRILSITEKNQSIFIFPILEELHFRWLIYNVGELLSITNMEFLIISALAFGIAHIPYLGEKSLYKTFQGVLLAALFLKLGVLVTILCHLFFNIFVYLNQENSHYFER